MRPILCVAASAIAVSVSASAQVTTPPSLGAAPRLTLPAVQRGTLPNGLRVVVAKNSEVPLVAAQLVILGGARLTDTPAGLATFAADMLDEGAAGRNTFQLADELSYQGARLSTSASWERFDVSLSAPKRTFAQAMALMADVVLRPTFASADIKRQRDLRLTQLLAARDNPQQVAQQVFYRNVYATTHPYHVALIGDSATTLALDSAGVRQFWNRAADPSRAALILTGDITLSDALALARKHFGAWKGPASPLPFPAAESVAAATASKTHIILVDKPNAPQSVIYMGAPGMSRGSADYARVAIMNTIVGGSFSSRLNDVLREQRGYSYGASSAFSWLPVPGPFIASSQVRTDVTDSSLVVFLREFRRIRDTSVTTTELTRAQNYVVLGALSHYETPSDVADALETSLLFNRPFETIIAELEAMKRLTTDDVRQGAQRIDPSQLTIVIVGDLAKIRPGIERLGLGSIEVQTF